MDGREFVKTAKEYAVDGAVDDIVAKLKQPKLSKLQRSNTSTSKVDQSIAQWINERRLVQQQRHNWFQEIDERTQLEIKALLEECAETTVLYLFSLLDGVGGDYDGVFEIVAVSSQEGRVVVNPQNSTMLHDLFSELCEHDRARIQK